MPPSALRFGPFVLDLERLCLRGPAGEVELRPKSFEVLRHLAERPRRVVPKEALIEAVWADVTVTDDSLTRCIGEVRRALAAERNPEWGTPVLYLRATDGRLFALEGGHGH